MCFKNGEKVKDPNELTFENGTNPSFFTPPTRKKKKKKLTKTCPPWTMMIEKRKISSFWVGPLFWGFDMRFQISRRCISFPWFFNRLWAHFPGLKWGNSSNHWLFRHGFAVNSLGKVSCKCVAFCCLIINNQPSEFNNTFNPKNSLRPCFWDRLPFEQHPHTCHPATSHQHLLPEFRPHRGSLGGWRWRLSYGLERVGCNRIWCI